MPGDPYNCHYDVCGILPNESGNAIAPFDENNNICKCDSSGVGLSTIPNQGDLSGKCFNPANVCSTWTSVGGVNSCGNCGSADNYSSQCVSQYVNQGNTSLPVCQGNAGSKNPIGYECINSCAGLTCNNNAPYSLSGSNPPICTCDCANPQTQIPQLPPSATQPTCTTNPYIYSSTDTTCSNPCLKSGTVLNIESFNPYSSTKTTCFPDASLCCSKNSITKTDNYIFSSTNTTTCT